VRKQRVFRLSEQLEVEDALREAYAPLRARRTDLSPLRVRAAVRWGRGAPRRQVGWARAVARLSELSVAVGMSAMVFMAAFGPVPERATGRIVDEAPDPVAYAVPRVTAPLDDAHYLRWLRLDRYVPLQDWLDPAVLHVGSGRPAQREAPVPATPNEPY
jgi:hypothetical protein